MWWKVHFSHSNHDLINPIGYLVKQWFEAKSLFYLKVLAQFGSLSQWISYNFGYHALRISDMPLWRNNFTKFPIEVLEIEFYA